MLEIKVFLDFHRQRKTLGVRRGGLVISVYKTLSISPLNYTRSAAKAIHSDPWQCTLPIYITTLGDCHAMNDDIIGYFTYYQLKPAGLPL